MKYVLASLLFFALVIGIVFLVFQKKSATIQEEKLSVIQSKTMKITSPAFKHNTPIPSKYTCDGENVNPPLAFEGVPASAKSLALIIDDPDAPSKTWVHWTMMNIDPKTTQISESSVPSEAIQGMTDFGKIGYGGPCPPSGTHRYFFKLYALDTKLDIPPASSDKKAIEEAMQGHIIDKAELIGLYSRRG